MFCRDDLQSNYTFSRNVTPLINLTLCGVPSPNVTWSYRSEVGIAARQLVDNYTYEY